MDQHLAVKTEIAAQGAVGGKAVCIGDVIVSGVQRQGAVRPRRRHQGGHGIMQIGAIRPMPPRHVLEKIVRPQQQRRRARRDRAQRQHRLRRFDHCPKRCRPGQQPRRAKVGGRGHFGQQDGIGPRHRPEVGDAFLTGEGIDPHHRDPAVKGAGANRIRDTGARRRLLIRPYRILQIEDHGIDGKGTRLFQRPDIAAWNKQGGADAGQAYSAPSTSRNSPSLTDWRILRASVYSGEL